MSGRRTWDGEVQRGGHLAQGSRCQAAGGHMHGWHCAVSSCNEQRAAAPGVWGLAQQQHPPAVACAAHPALRALSFEAAHAAGTASAPLMAAEVAGLSCLDAELEHWVWVGAAAIDTQHLHTWKQLWRLQAGVGQGKGLAGPQGLAAPLGAPDECLCCAILGTGQPPAAHLLIF